MGVFILFLICQGNADCCLSSRLSNRISFPYHPCYLKSSSLPQVLWFKMCSVVVLCSSVLSLLQVVHFMLMHTFLFQWGAVTAQKLPSTSLSRFPCNQSNDSTFSGTPDLLPFLNLFRLEGLNPLVVLWNVIGRHFTDSTSAKQAISIIGCYIFLKIFVIFKPCVWIPIK